MRDTVRLIFNRMASIPKDKLLHLFYGTVLAAPVVIWGSLIEAIGFMLFIAIGKEIIDAQLKLSPPSILDALFTFAPTVLLILVRVC